MRGSNIMPHIQLITSDLVNSDLPPLSTSRLQGLLNPAAGCWTRP